MMFKRNKIIYFYKISLNKNIGCVITAENTLSASIELGRIIFNMLWRCAKVGSRRFVGSRVFISFSIDLYSSSVGVGSLFQFNVMARPYLYSRHFKKWEEGRAILR